MIRTLPARSFTAAMTVLLSLAVLPPGNAAEGDCPADEAEAIPCQAKQGDPMAMYVLGRRAYEEGRASGSFTESLGWARKLVAAGDKNGERLLKMTYMQLGWGGHKDYVQSYVWLSEGIARGDDYLVAWRNKLVEKMSPEQLDEARKIAGR